VGAAAVRRRAGIRGGTSSSRRRDAVCADEGPSAEMRSVRRTERPAADRMTEDRRSTATVCDQPRIARCRSTSSTTPRARSAAINTRLPSPNQVLLILTLLSTCCAVGKLASLLNHEFV